MFNADDIHVLLPRYGYCMPTTGELLIQSEWIISMSAVNMMEFPVSLLRYISFKGSLFKTIKVKEHSVYSCYKSKYFSSKLNHVLSKLFVCVFFRSLTSKQSRHIQTRKDLKKPWQLYRLVFIVTLLKKNNVHVLRTFQKYSMRPD